MRIENFLVIPLLALSACDSSENEAMSTSFVSSASVDLLASCISQDHDAAFPRLFPYDKAPGRRVFKTYNGIAVTIEVEAGSRRITVSSSQALTSNQTNYIRKCISMTEAA
ncbi:MAG: hypothetical protein KDE55_20555 [Novosphingobium sp.]|nr:hypothetical protein [Novosphingobium sp.]